MNAVKPKKKDTCDKCGSPLMLRKDDEPETVAVRQAMADALAAAG